MTAVLLDIAVDVKAPTPPYEQIRAQVAAYVADGSLRAGDRLPTMRALAADLGVATGTVGRAYAELEAAGLVTSRRRTGTVVAAGPARPAASDDGVRRAAADLVAQARAAGLDGDTVLALVRAAWTRPVRRPEPADGATPVRAGGGPSAAGTARTGR